MEKKEWYLSQWLVLYRCALGKKFFRSNIFILYRIAKKGLRYFCKIIYKKRSDMAGRNEKRILQNLKL